MTLVENPSASVRGVAYRVHGARAAQVLASLDDRERAGYERVEVCLDFVEAPFGRGSAVVYQARPGNPGFAEQATVEQIAEVVRWARGPSGDNASYVRQLARALRELGEDDPHVAAVERMLGDNP